jgi:hypothetical protein
MISELQEQLTKAFLALGITTEEVAEMTTKVKNAPNHKAAKQAFEDFKANVKKIYREKAREHHPDKGGDEEEFKKFGQVMSLLDSIEIGARPIHRIHTVRKSQGGTYTTTTNASDSTNGYWRPF